MVVRLALLALALFVDCAGACISVDFVAGEGATITVPLPTADLQALDGDSSGGRCGARTDVG